MTGSVESLSALQHQHTTRRIEGLAGTSLRSPASATLATLRRTRQAVRALPRQRSCHSRQCSQAPQVRFSSDFSASDSAFFPDAQCSSVLCHDPHSRWNPSGFADRFRFVFGAFPVSCDYQHQSAAAEFRGADFAALPNRQIRVVWLGREVTAGQSRQQNI